MPPEAIQLGLFVLQEAIKNAPALAQDLRELFTKADPTPADWAALHAKVQAQTFEKLVPNSEIPIGK